MKSIFNLSKRVLLSTKGIPDKKRYIEFFTASLSVPVLITVIMLNVNNLKNSNKQNTPAPTPEKRQETVYVPVSANNSNSKNTNKESSKDSVLPSPSLSINPSDPACKSEIGPVSISSPSEGEVVTDNPVYIIVNYKLGEYCAVVWAYRINGGPWSVYDDKSVALYDLLQGGVKIEVKIKSIVTGEEKILTRNITYNGPILTTTPTISPTLPADKTSSPSAN